MKSVAYRESTNGICQGCDDDFTAALSVMCMAERDSD